MLILIMDSIVDIVRGMWLRRFLQSLSIHQMVVRKDHLDEMLQHGMVQLKLLDIQYPRLLVLAL